LSHLEDLGVGSIWVDRGRVTAVIPLQLILPPRLEVVRDVRDQLLSAASAMESALVGRFPSEKGERAAEAADDPSTYGGYESKGRGGRTKGVAPGPAVMVAVFLVAVAIAFAIADPMWARGTEASWPDRLSMMEGRLVFTTLVAGAIGLMAARLTGGKPIIWGIGLSWPMLFYTTAIWAYYVIFTMSEAPVAENFLADMEGVVTPILVLLTSAPVLFFSSGWVGARLGQQRRTEVRQRG